ncbi:MAG: methyl-accepting chemotaxis protein, partial [Alphaproteobacteria bacterium]|nr:methyl-accepting chemotaxis protein [Alphaproteobacteria bacterium]
MLNNLKIASRLLIGFGLLVLIIAGLSSYSVYSARDTRDVLGKVVRFQRNETVTERALKRIQEGRLYVWMAL